MERQTHDYVLSEAHLGTAEIEEILLDIGVLGDLKQSRRVVVVTPDGFGVTGLCD